MKNFIFFITLCAVCPCSYAQINDKDYLAIFRSNSNDTFSLHQPTYFAFGVHDLKLQFSLKYRLNPKIPLYFAYSQIMFWDIYKKSKPFRDINYRPEVFVRLLENDKKSINSLDLGYMHLSNGRDKEQSRSFERIFIRANLLTKIKRHNLGAFFTVYKVFDADQNENIEQHIGFWETSLYFSHVLVMGKQNTDLEVKAYAGKHLINFNQGAVQLSLIHNFNSAYFNPSLYLQYFQGYAESLLSYEVKKSELRLGLMLYF